MRRWLRDFVKINSGEKDLKTIFSSTISKFRALDAFNSFIKCCNGNGYPLLKIRLSALEAFMNSYGRDYQKALFEFFREYIPHWQCTQEFSPKNMRCFVEKISNSCIFLQPSAKISIHAPKFKQFRSKIESETMAAVERKNVKCIIHTEKDAVRRNKFGINVCKSCTITLGQALKNKLITKETTKEEIISYLKEKQRKKAIRTPKR